MFITWLYPGTSWETRLFRNILAGPLVKSFLHLVIGTYWLVQQSFQMKSDQEDKKDLNKAHKIQKYETTVSLCWISSYSWKLKNKSWCVQGFISVHTFVIWKSVPTQLSMTFPYTWCLSSSVQSAPVTLTLKCSADVCIFLRHSVLKWQSECWSKGFAEGTISLTLFALLDKKAILQF